MGQPIKKPKQGALIEILIALVVLATLLHCIYYTSLDYWKASPPVAPLANPQRDNPCGCVPVYPPCTMPCGGCCPGGCKPVDNPTNR